VIHASRITADETWKAADGPHTLQGDVNILAKVTVEPCTAILISKQAIITVAELPERKFKGTVARTANALDPATRTLLTLAEQKAPMTGAALAKAQTTAREAERRNSPVSILVSKKDKRVYIRQGLAPVLDAPATIRDPETPLGTHVYVAVDTAEDGKAMRWLTMTYPQASSGPDAKPQQQRSTLPRRQ
jgi:hypothetical protein